MIHEEKKKLSSDVKTDFWVDKQNFSIHSSDKQLDLWLKRQHFTIPKWRGEPFMSLPRTSSQLFRVIQDSGYPAVHRGTVEECLSELVGLGVLMKFTRTGTDRQYNRVFYALPWAIKYDDDFQYRHYYIPWKLSVPKETMDELMK